MGRSPSSLRDPSEELSGKGRSVTTRALPGARAPKSPCSDLALSTTPAQGKLRSRRRLGARATPLLAGSRVQQKSTRRFRCGMPQNSRLKGAEKSARFGLRKSEPAQPVVERGACRHSVMQLGAVSGSCATPEFLRRFWQLTEQPVERTTLRSLLHQCSFRCCCDRGTLGARHSSVGSCDPEGIR